MAERYRIAYRFALVVWLVLVSACGGGGSQPGGEQPRYDYPVALDVSFGSQGYQVFSTGLDEKSYLAQFVVNDFIIDNLGRTVIVGTRTSADREAWLLRLRPDGTPDPACGQGGWFSFKTGGPAVATKVAQLGSGEYVIAGQLGVASIWFLRQNCSIETTRGTAGQSVVPAPSPTEIQGGVSALVVDNLGRIVVTVGTTMSGRLLLARFTPEGNKDTSFGSGEGYVSVASLDGAAPRPADIAVRPDGRILVAAAMVYSSQVGHWAGFVQLQENGALDTTFGDRGFVSIRPSPNYVAVPKALALLSDGSAIQAGLTQPGVLVGTVISADAYWLKVSQSGTPASVFGTNGFLFWDASPDGKRSSSNYVTSMLPLEEKILSCQNWLNNTKVGQQIEAASMQVLVQSRQLATGAIDTSFFNGTGWLPRQGDLSASCIGLRKAQDGTFRALLDYGPAGKATGETFALVRVKK